MKLLNVVKNFINKIFNKKNLYDYNLAYVKELYNFIIDTYEIMECNVISAKIIYSQLRLLKPKLLENIKSIKDYEEFWDYLKKNYHNKLFFSKPFVAIKPFNNIYEVTLEYLRTLNGFDNQTIIKFENKIGYESTKGSNIYIEALYNEFIQVDETMMIKKDIFNLDEIVLKRIKNNLELYFKTNEVLETKTFKAFFAFPTLPGYSWNKYLLVGIVRTYLNADYKIEKIAHETDYIIRRK